MSEIIQAFSHPEVRAAATAGDAPLDRISLRDHEVHVEIGAYQTERGVTQRVVFNIVVELAPVSGPIDDDVDRILSYDRLTDAIAIELAAERLNLLETLAERIATRILTEPRAFRVFVRIEKLDRGPGALGVEIVRSSDQVDTSKDIATPMPRPVVVHVTSDALASERLETWLSYFAGLGEAVIVTTDAAKSIQVENFGAQRRIELLAIEQQAWAIAARHPRSIVRATRSELDWAMKQNELSVWAPSKMVLDAVNGPTGTAEDLAKWLAEEVNARAFFTLADNVIDAPSLPDV